MKQSLFAFLLGTAYVLASASTMMPGTDVVIADVALSDQWFTVTEGYDVTYSAALSAATLSGAYFSVGRTWDSMDQTMKALLGLAGALIVLSIVTPDLFADMFDSIWAGVAGLTVGTGGFWAVAQGS